MSKILSIFSSKKCLDSLLLNILGVQPLRYCLSKILYNTKLLIKRNNSFKNFRKYGYDYKENFLENNDFEKIKNEFNEAINNSQLANQTEQIHGVYDHGIKYTTMPINKNIQNLYPNLYKITQNEFIKNYFEKNEQKKNIQIFCRLERIMVKDIDIPDPNKDYHYDTGFVHSYKNPENPIITFEVHPPRRCFRLIENFENIIKEIGIMQTKEKDMESQIKNKYKIKDININFSNPLLIAAQIISQVHNGIKKNLNEKNELYLSPPLAEEIYSDALRFTKNLNYIVDTFQEVDYWDPDKKR